MRSTIGNVVEGNFIGTNATGNGTPTGINSNPGGNGVWISDGASGNTIGGTTASARNIISGNAGDGVDIGGISTKGNVVEGNYIGTNAAGTAALANTGDGIAVGGDAADNTIGGTTPEARNVISGNTHDGISITGSSASGNVVEGDYIGTNVTGAVAVPNSNRRLPSTATQPAIPSAASRHHHRHRGGQRHLRQYLFRNLPDERQRGRRQSDRDQRYEARQPPGNGDPTAADAPGARGIYILDSGGTLYTDDTGGSAAGDGSRHQRQRRATGISIRRRHQR